MPVDKTPVTPLLRETGGEEEEEDDTRTAPAISSIGGAATTGAGTVRLDEACFDSDASALPVSTSVSLRAGGGALADSLLWDSLRWPPLVFMLLLPPPICSAATCCASCAASAACCACRCACMRSFLPATLLGEGTWLKVGKRASSARDSEPARVRLPGVLAPVPVAVVARAEDEADAMWEDGEG